MITENGSIKVRTRINGNVHRELNKPVRNLGICYTVCGAVIFAVFVLAVVFTALAGEKVDYLDIVIIVSSLIFTVCGIIILVRYGLHLKKCETQDKEDEVEFFSDYLILNEYLNGSVTTTSKIYYNLLVKKRESKHYLFLYNSAVTAICVEKEKLTDGELHTVRNLVNCVGTTPVAFSFPTDSPNRAPTNEPDDPFADFASHDGERVENAETPDNPPVDGDKPE